MAYIEDTARDMAGLLGRENTLRENDIREHLLRRPGLPLTLFRSLSVREMARVTEKMGKYKGVAIEVDSERVYPGGSSAAHLIGYVRPDDSSRADDRTEFSSNYYIPDQVGRAGIE